MDKQAYLRRIGYDGPVEPTIAALRGIHRAHMRSVPFENLDMHIGRHIVLDEATFFDKVVRQHRGGFCYELNGLFAALLRDLGFRVTLLSGRVVINGQPGPEYDHLTLLVELDERWIADVGFGESFQEPLRLDFEGEQPQESGTYRIAAAGEGRAVEMLAPNGKWKQLYLFSLTPHPLEDFRGMCEWHQVAPESPFRKRVCSMATAHGRATLSERRLIVVEGGRREIRRIDGDEEYRRTLRDRFGIELGHFSPSPRAGGEGVGG